MKNELPLQLFFIFLVATIVAIGSLRFLPDINLHLHPVVSTAQAVDITSPLSGTIETVIKPKTPPTAIYIKPFDLTLTVAPGEIVGNEWTLYNDKISWLASSAVPGKGNVILYGHNRRGLFADLKKLNIGDIVSIKYEEKWINYQVVTVKKVVPTDVDAVFTSDNQLTLYTCDGKFDQKRLVVIAKSV